ncbi:MAG: VWA domain-containing protein [Acidobacteria bacterium]|nr:VWA domain-containing protein [Acidobacteriota bacterium]MBS1865467.1 VWA domain-containing protein [Acidobacteriota bacterium]
MPLLTRFAASVAAFSLTFGGVAPAVPQEPAQGGAISTQVSLVSLFATVRDKNKRIVADLKQEDFKVFQDNEEQKIAFFSKEVTLPITIGLLIDTSGSEQNRLPAEQDAATRFLERVMKKGDEAMVMSFDLDVDLLADFTEDKHIIERAINKAQVNAVGGGGVVTPGTIPSNTGGTHFYDAVYLACGEKLATEAGRKALVIITDAQDEGSKVRLDEAIEAAQRSDTVVHVLLVHDPGYGWRPDVAKKLSDETGGRTIEVSSEKRLEEAFDQISEELRSQYQIGYYYPANKPKDGGFRKIKVEVNNKDQKVLSRKGFYAPKG